MHDKLPGLKVFKPTQTEVLHRVFSPSPSQFVMSFGIIVPFALSPEGQTQHVDTPSLWDVITPALGAENIFDECWPKPNGECLAVGHAYPPADHHDQPIAVTLNVGPVSKRLAVFGDRHFTVGGGISAPQPFARMPISSSYAFGGPEFAANPNGKGIERQDGLQELPNIEHPNQLIFSPSDKPEPAGFGPLSADLPQRSTYLGPLSEQWLKERWPHLPVQVDTRYFLAAPKDQQRKGYWQGGEAVSVSNMHPQHPYLEGQVPKLRPRFFVHQSEGTTDAKFRELVVEADTVWLLPEAQLGLLIFRGCVPVADGTGFDINAFYAEFESPDSPEYEVGVYLNNCLRLMQPELFQDLPDPFAEETQIALGNLDGEQLLQKIQEQRSYFEDSLQKSGMREDEFIRQLEANPHTRQLAQSLVERNGSLSGFFNEIQSLLEILQNPEQVEQASHERHLNDVITPYPQPAAHAVAQPTVAAPEALHDAGAAIRHRQIVINALQNGQSCAQLDLSYANLAGLDLAGLDFSGAILAGANFSGAKLQGACLDNIFASNTRFDAADMAGCSLRQATLHQASFTGAILRGADLQHSNCTEANFTSADLSGCNLQSAILTQAWMQNIRAERLMADHAQFTHANLDGAWFNGARLAHADFSGASAQRLNLQDCLAPGANFSQADLTGVNMQNALLDGSQAGPGTSMVSARLSAAQLENASWGGADLTGADMVGINGSKSDFSATQLLNAKVTGADLRGSNFDRASLRNADFSTSNLMQASFMNANLTASNFSQTNLYSATFVDTEIAGARFTDANLDRTALAY